MKEDDAGGGYRLLMTTVTDEKEAVLIGEKVVGEGLAACCNIVPGLRSIYRWQGEVRDEGEVLCLIKTRAEKVAALEARVKEIHSYDMPEIISVKIESGSAGYLKWIDDCTKEV